METEMIETSLQQPVTLNETQTEVERWQTAVTTLETKSAALAQRRKELETERRALLAEKAGGNDTAADRLRALREELIENEEEREGAGIALPEASRRLAEAKETRKAQAIAAMEAMLTELEAQRSTLITQARKSEDPAALERAYSCHRRCYGLKNALYNLTHERRFYEFWSFANFGERLEQEVTRFHRIAKSTGFVVPLPWVELEQIATEN